MKRRFNERIFGKAAIALLALTVLMLTIIASPTVKAGATISFGTPSQAPTGALATLYLQGFPQGSSIEITLGDTVIGYARADYYSGNAMAGVRIPNVAPGDYTVTATCKGVTATTTLTVIQGASPTPTVAPTESTGTSNPLIPTPTSNLVTGGSGFWSPLTGALIAVVIVLGIILVFMFMRRGKSKMPEYEERSRYERSPRYDGRPPSDERSVYGEKPRYDERARYQPQMSSSSRTPYTPYTPPRTNQPASTSQLPPHTTICKHCHRPVRDDLNVCPYCFKRIR